MGVIIKEITGDGMNFEALGYKDFVLRLQGLELLPSGRADVIRWLARNICHNTPRFHTHHTLVGVRNIISQQNNTR